MKGFKESRSWEERQNLGTQTLELLQIWLYINYPLVLSYTTQDSEPLLFSHI